MNDPRARQAAINAASRDQWGTFADHRRRVSGLLGADAAPGRTRICVLGAGNGNDLDLPALLRAHREVHLVDLDAEALKRGAERQGATNHPALVLHGGVDVTGMLDALGTWSPWSSIGAADLSALAGWPADRVAPTLPGSFDLVASTCLLSQLMEAARNRLGTGHARLGAAEAAIRTGHLRLLARLASRGSRACLISEVVSSETLPELESLPEPSLAGLLPRLAREANHFRGLHPSELVTALRGDPALIPRLSGWEAARPWRWRLHARLYLVWAMTFRVGMGSPGSG